MGASCVRECERSSHEVCTPEDILPEKGLPGLPNSSALTTEALRKCGPAASNESGEFASGNVPLVPNWFKALKREAAESSTPRFNDSQDNASTAATPRISPRRPEERSISIVALSPASHSDYEGTHQGGLKHGLGRLRLEGSTYEGDFRNDLKHGVGVLTWDDGRQYHGQFQLGKFHGSAIMTWPDGRRYWGQYAEDRKAGEGTFSWPDGRRYQGQWILGKRHGRGVYTNAKGITRTGLWQMDRPLSWEAVGQISANPAEPDGEQSLVDAAPLQDGHEHSIGSRATTPRNLTPRATPRTACKDEEPVVRSIDV